MAEVELITFPVVALKSHLSQVHWLMRVSADGPGVQEGGYYQKSQVDPSETCCQASFKFKGLEGCSISFRSLWALSYSSGVACRAWLQCIQGPIPSTLRAVGVVRRTT